MVKKLLHTRYRVTDLEKTVSFYRDVLGLEETRRHTSGRGSQLVFLKAPGGGATGSAFRTSEIESGTSIGRTALKVCFAFGFAATQSSASTIVQKTAVVSRRHLMDSNLEAIFLRAQAVGRSGYSLAPR